MASRNPSLSSALVVGARRGLGRAFAEALVQAGYQVYGTTRSREAVERLEGVEWWSLDPASATSVEAFCEERAERLGAIEVLVNNAGFADFGAISDLPREALGRHLAVMVEAPWRLSQAVLPGMRERRSGAIVNVSSLAVELPIPYLPAYNTAKAALSAFSASLMLELAGSGVQVIDFRPGDYATRFYDTTRVFGAADTAKERAWRAMQAQTAHGPPPARAARDLLRALRRGRSGVVRSGAWFQAGLAAWAARVLPSGWMRRRILRYYEIGGD